MHARVSEDSLLKDRPALILVHGLVVSSRYMVPIAELLSAHYRVYAPDLPGFGKSGKPPHVLSLVELSNTLAAWMQEANLERAAFLGNSFGCQIIADLSVRHPGRVERAVLQGPTMDPRGRTVLGQIGGFLLDMPQEPLSLLAIELLDYVSAGTVRSWRTFRYALEDRIEGKLPNMNVPTLVVRGSRDRIVSQCWAEEVTSMLPLGRLVVIPGAAHTANYGWPLEFAREVHAFLSDSGKA
jgi:2-hydroxy-6-oxonona-2,4-dienedioate hydrolase